MTAQTTAADLGRLRWRCRRGMKELDKLLTAYLDGDFRNASADDRSHFQELLELPDPQLYDYCLGRERPRVAAVASLIDRIAGRSIDFGPLTRTLPVP